MADEVPESEGLKMVCSVDIKDSLEEGLNANGSEETEEI